MCVSTRERNQFPSVLLQPLGHLFHDGHKVADHAFRIAPPDGHVSSFRARARLDRPCGLEEDLSACGPSSIDARRIAPENDPFEEFEVCARRLRGCREIPKRTLSPPLDAQEIRPSRPIVKPTCRGVEEKD